jgi:hypothetical protein
MFRLYSRSRPACIAPKAISPWPLAPMAIMGSTRSRWARSHRSASTIRQRPTSRQPIGAVTVRLRPTAWAAAPGCGGGCEGEGQVDTCQAAESGLFQAGHRFDPAERLFDPLAHPLAHRIATVPRGAPVDCRAPAAGVLGDMRAHVQFAQLHHEVLRIIALVGREGDRARPVATRRDHVECGQPFGMTRDTGQPGVDDQPGAVLHQAVADEAKLGLHARGWLPGATSGGRPGAPRPCGTTGRRDRSCSHGSHSSACGP